MYMTNKKHSLWVGSRVIWVKLEIIAQVRSTLLSQLSIERQENYKVEPDRNAVQNDSLLSTLPNLTTEGLLLGTYFALRLQELCFMELIYFEEHYLFNHNPDYPVHWNDFVRCCCLAHSEKWVMGELREKWSRHKSAKCSLFQPPKINAIAYRHASSQELLVFYKKMQIRRKF